MEVRLRQPVRDSLAAKLQVARKDARNRRVLGALSALAGAVVYMLLGGVVTLALTLTLHGIGLPWPRIGFVDAFTMFALIYLLGLLLRGPRA